MLDPIHIEADEYSADAAPEIVTDVSIDQYDGCPQWATFQDVLGLPTADEVQQQLCETDR